MRRLVNVLDQKPKSERQQAFELANKILDRVNADPDDDLAVLARQLLRALEEIEQLRSTVIRMMEENERLRFENMRLRKATGSVISW